uniref:Pre-rRNA-processing protein TSR2 homolog n=1 Tax=Aceria tosichella TaxID=561515 RepID=A0A6G1S592_9ACAR
MATSSTTIGQPITQAQTIPHTGIETFRRAVHYVLTEWPSLNFAIENGMGGAESKQKQAWMCDHIAEVMIKGKDIDLEDYLAEIVNQEFDTLVEDGSLEYNAKWIEKFFKDCQQGKEQEVLDSINKAAARKQSLGNMRIPPPMNATQESSDDDDDEDDDDDT